MGDIIQQESLDLTVAILLHGDAPRINRVVESVMAQRYALGQIRIMCLDDGSSPKARQVVESLGVDVVDVPPKCSISVAKNTALRLCLDEYVFFLDDHIELEADGVSAAMCLLRENPRLAGVCGFYRSAKSSDWNVLRDIKRHSIYGKADAYRSITLDDFSTFSTGIGIVRKTVFERFGFPEESFPPDFGGEDVPALLTALDHGYEFAYLPALRGVHEHNVSFRAFVKKVEIEVRGRYSVFYWAAGQEQLAVPYLHGFLNFPLLLCFSLPVALVASVTWTAWALLIPAAAFLFESALSLRCLRTPVSYRFRDRLCAAFYVLVSDLLTPMCGLQYAVCTYKRPYKRLGFSRLFRMLELFVQWELAKLGVYRRWKRQVRSPSEQVRPRVAEFDRKASQSKLQTETCRQG